MSCLTYSQECWKELAINWSCCKEIKANLSYRRMDRFRCISKFRSIFLYNLELHGEMKQLKRNVSLIPRGMYLLLLVFSYPIQMYVFVKSWTKTYYPTPNAKSTEVCENWDLIQMCFSLRFDHVFQREWSKSQTFSLLGTPVKAFLDLTLASMPSVKPIYCSAKPISANPGLKFCFTFVFYLLMYCLE